MNIDIWMLWPPFAKSPHQKFRGVWFPSTNLEGSRGLDQAILWINVGKPEKFQGACRTLVRRKRVSSEVSDDINLVRIMHPDMGARIRPNRR